MYELTDKHRQAGRQTYVSPPTDRQTDNPMESHWNKLVYAASRGDGPRKKKHVGLIENEAGCRFFPSPPLYPLTHSPVPFMFTVQTN